MAGAFSETQRRCRFNLGFHQLQASDRRLQRQDFRGEIGLRRICQPGAGSLRVLLRLF